jgi:UDP-N-acetyl-D-mannosaminuronic acid dehydrogenase
MKILVIGLGYIGLPTAAILATNSIEVIGVDVDKTVVDTVNKGEVHIVEPGLDRLVKIAVRNKFLRATLLPEDSDVFMIAVPTPFKGDHDPDLTYIKSAVKSIAPLLKKGNSVILESTSPVGTTEKITKWMAELRPDLNFPVFGKEDDQVDIYVAYCPERVLPGQVLHELIENDRIIGGVTAQCSRIAKEVYEIFVQAECLITDCRTAELSKLTENSFRDVNIAFANELSLVCDKLGINVWELIKFANHHPRVNILQPGPGVGGHCIAVDPWFIVSSAPNETALISTARLVNDQKPSFVLNKIEEAVYSVGKKKSELKIACFGLSFKPNIDDLRESPALNIAKKVSKMGFLRCYLIEPHINELNKDLAELGDYKLVDYQYALDEAEIVVLLVDHDIFKMIDKTILLEKKVIDTRGIWL